MAQSQQDEIASAALSNTSNAVMSTMTLASKSSEPIARSVAQCNEEMAGLLKLRARALVDATNRMSQCKTPAEFADLNMKYWQTATQDYLDATRKITTVFTSTAASKVEQPTPVAGNPFLNNPMVHAWTTLWEKSLKADEPSRTRDFTKSGELSPTSPSSNGRHAS
jgi:hypothetical protein